MAFVNKESIDKEDWKKAEGVKFTGIQTNSALTERDYSIECKPNHLIALVKGYHIWWCSTHHQPERLCELGKLKEVIDSNVLVILKSNKGER